MTALLQHVRRTIRRHGLLPSGARVVVGLSGGSDSVALTRLLSELAPTLGFSIVSLAHFNHRLRATADRDERFCRDFAAGLRLPIAIAAADVQGYAASERLSVEDAARRARYTFLHGIARDAGADRIAVGHTRDDQAETLLLKLVRGAGLSGLGGVYPQRGLLIRPLLDAARRDLRGYLGEIGQSWVEDESNENVINPRNRIRHRVIPELELAYPGAVRAMARAAAVSREDGQWLDDMARLRYEELVVARPEPGTADGGTGGGLELDAAAVRAEPLPLQRRIVLAAIRTLSGGREAGLDHVERVLDVLAGDAGGADLPGCRVELRRGKLVLLK